VGTGRYGLAGAGIGNAGIYYGGISGTNILNTVTRIDCNGAMVGTEGNVGTVRDYFAGAGI
jgi:hypothetical protein